MNDEHRILTRQRGHNWRDLGTLAPMASARSTSFFHTERGIGCIQHALMRMRAAALKRLEMITVSRTYPWALARDVDLRDRVRMEVRDGETKTVVIGKVISIDRRVEGVASVKITIAVPLGTGRADAVADKAGSDYGDGDYFGDSYTDVAQSQYLVPQVDGGAVGIFSVNGDVEAVSQASPLSVPVDAFRLGDPWYAVKECFVDWQAGKQVSEALARMAGGRDPRSVTRDCPTGIRMAMRFMPSYATLERIYRVHGILTVSPRGIDLQGGEP